MSTAAAASTNVLVDSHPQPLDLQVLLLPHGAQLLLVLAGQLFCLDLQAGTAALARQLRRRWEKAVRTEPCELSFFLPAQQTVFLHTSAAVRANIHTVHTLIIIGLGLATS